MSHSYWDQGVEAYVGSEGLGPTDLAAVQEGTSHVRPRTVVEEWMAVLRVAIPGLIVGCVVALVWVGLRQRETKQLNSRDRLWGWAARLGGKEFDPKKHPFSSQYEFKLPEVKPIDWDEYSRKYERALQAHQHRLTEQIRRYHHVQRRKPRGE